MIWRDWLKKWKMTNLQLNPPFLNVELKFALMAGVEDPLLLLEQAEIRPANTDVSAP